MTMQNETNVLLQAGMKPTQGRFDRASLLSVGGILAALGAASCCVVPFALFIAGVSGAWIGNWTALKPYQPVFVGIAMVCLGFGFYSVYWKSKPADCAGDAYCARPSAGRNAKVGLWIATVLIVIAVGFPYAARFFLDT